MQRLYMELQLMTYLMYLRIMPNLKGYTYLKEAALRLCEDEKLKFHMSNTLYKELADRFGEKVSLFDRALRHAVEVSYRRDGIQQFEKKLKIDFSERKPSAKEIICVLAEKIKMDAYEKFGVPA